MGREKEREGREREKRERDKERRGGGKERPEKARMVKSKSANDGQSKSSRGGHGISVTESHKWDKQYLVSLHW